MRYYEFIMNTSVEQLEKNAKIKLREYGYSGSIGAMNSYMYQTVKNGMGFFAYREESGNSILAAFYYDEKKEVLSNVYDYIIEGIKNAFKKIRIQSNPNEITMYQFLDCFLEGKRRGYNEGGYRFIEFAKVFICEHGKNEPNGLRFHFQEKIISENKRIAKGIYDQSFIKELSNIESHVNHSGFIGNMVHYIISSRSVEAACDMTEGLVSSLAKANRISGRRMEIISEMEPDLYSKNNHIEDIIENNYGGVVVFDLSEKFGYDPVDYQMVCKFIETLVKKYKKQCLFVFTYNMDNPGFSYYLLPKLNRYILPVMLAEGTADRKKAVSYMKELIKGSEYAEFVGQAGEFMKQFPGNEFSQTDVLRAYEQFEPWCLNRNIVQAYNYHSLDDFTLDRDSRSESSYEELHKMIGLHTVKEEISKIIATNIVEKERKNRKGHTYKTGTMHMIFGGNPGSAKTTVAKLFAGIAKEEGILKSGILVERGGMDLDGLGCVYAIREAFMAAKGGVLFIDEAYSLKSDMAVTVLIQEMETHREEVIVVLAGYHERMQEFMNINEGLKSRIPYWVDFPDYNAEELTEIFKLMIEERGFAVEKDAIKEAHYILEKASHRDNFGNGRYVRNLIDYALQNQSVRLLRSRKSADKIQKKELFLIAKEDISMLEDGLREEKVSGAAKEELKDMIGLTKTKSIIEKAMASYKLRKLCMDRGIAKDKASLHMVFSGNPGTAKTTVARLFATIMKEEKVLSTGNFVEVGRAELVGTHVGKTAPLVKKRFQEAKGGILFIDEAYSLCEHYENGFGDEAINTIVQEMENHRDNVIVIFAGYPDKMKHFLDKNPGLLSRIAFQVEFEDYSVDELCDITKLMLERKQMKITNQAMEKLRIDYENVKEQSDYGNGRFVRKMIEEAEMNLAERLLQLEEAKITLELLTTIEEVDVPDIGKQTHERFKIGFEG